MTGASSLESRRAPRCASGPGYPAGSVQGPVVHAASFFIPEDLDMGDFDGSGKLMTTSVRLLPMIDEEDWPRARAQGGE